MSSGIAQVYETMSLRRTTKQNPKHNGAELDVTRKWIISHSIPSLRKAAKPICGVVNDCRTLKSIEGTDYAPFQTLFKRKDSRLSQLQELGPRWCEQLGHVHSVVWLHDTICEAAVTDEPGAGNYVPSVP